MKYREERKQLVKYREDKPLYKVCPLFKILMNFCFHIDFQEEIQYNK